MSRIRDAIDRAVTAVAVGNHGEPAGARRATQVASVMAKVVSDGGHTDAALACSAAGVLAVVAAKFYGTPDEDTTYATFDIDEQPKRGWFR